MTTQKACPECGSANLVAKGDISAVGGYGPDLLPGAGSLFKPAKMKAVVCKDCGLIRFFVAQDALARINSEHGWQRLL